MTNLILHIVTFVVWLAYLFPPLAKAENHVTQITRGVLTAIISFCIGASLGVAIAEFIPM